MKNKIERVLVAYDFSNHSKIALKKALNFCTHWNAELVVLHVIEADVSKVFSEQVNRDWALRVEKDLNLHVDNALKNLNIQTEVVVVQGNPAHEIIKISADKNADLIVMGSSGRSALGYALLGHVADKVVRYSSLPVYLVKKENVSKGLLPVESPVFSDDVLMWAQKINPSQGFWKPVHVVEDLALLWDDFSGIVDDSFEQAKKDYKKMSEDYLSQYSFLAESLVLRGSTRPHLVDYIKNQDVDLVLATTHGLKGFKHFALGSTTEYLARYAACDVLVIPHPEQKTEMKKALDPHSKVTLGSVLFC